MAVALKNGALTTLATLKDAIGIAQTSTDRDDALRRMINVATALITKWTSRTFHRQAFTDERYTWRGGPRLVLNRAPLLTLTSVAVRDAVAVLDSSLFQVEDTDAAIVFVRASLPTFGRARYGIAQDLQPGTEPPDLLVTYEGGYVTPEQADTGGAFVGETVTLPDDVEQAAIELAAHLFASPVGFAAGEVQSEMLGDASVSYRPDTGTDGDKVIPPFIRAKLTGYKAIVIV